MNGTNVDPETPGKARKNVVVGTGFAYENGCYHLFYDTDFNNAGDYAMAYAFSRDGLNWLKPNLGLVEWRGTKNNHFLNIPKGAEGTWNELRMCSGGGFYHVGKWYLWVAGYHYNQQNKLQSQLTLYMGNSIKNLRQVDEKSVLGNGQAGTFDSHFIRVPCVIWDQDKFRMYYTASNGEGDWLAGYAESKDGVHWLKPKLGIIDYRGTKNNNLILAADSERNEFRVAHPWVFKDEGIYRIYYSVSVGGRSTYAVGTGVSEDGIHWHKNPEVVVLSLGDEGAFDQHYAAIPKVIREKNIYKMWYTGYAPHAPPDGEDAYALGYATSDDGVHWTKYKKNPVFDGGGNTCQCSDWPINSVTSDC